MENLPPSEIRVGFKPIAKAVIWTAFAISWILPLTGTFILFAVNLTEKEKPLILFCYGVSFIAAFSAVWLLRRIYRIATIVVSADGISYRGQIVVWEEVVQITENQGLTIHCKAQRIVIPVFVDRYDELCRFIQSRVVT